MSALTPGPRRRSVRLERSRRALVALTVITAIGGALRFYNLAWGAPYFHFHMDEHYVFMGADLLRMSMRAAALSGKFFMYGR